MCFIHISQLVVCVRHRSYTTACESAIIYLPWLVTVDCSYITACGSASFIYHGLWVCIIYISQLVVQHRSYTAACESASFICRGLWLCTIHISQLVVQHHLYSTATQLANQCHSNAAACDSASFTTACETESFIYRRLWISIIQLPPVRININHIPQLVIQRHSFNILQLVNQHFTYLSLWFSINYMLLLVGQQH